MHANITWLATTMLLALSLNLFSGTPLGYKNSRIGFQVGVSHTQDEARTALLNHYKNNYPINCYISSLAYQEFY